MQLARLWFPLRKTPPAHQPRALPQVHASKLKDFQKAPTATGFQATHSPTQQGKRHDTTSFRGQDRLMLEQKAPNSQKKPVLGFQFHENALENWGRISPPTHSAVLKICCLPLLPEVCVCGSGGGGVPYTLRLNPPLHHFAWETSPRPQEALAAALLSSSVTCEMSRQLGGGEALPSGRHLQKKGKEDRESQGSTGNYPTPP